VRFVVYAMIDPVTDAPFYIGRSAQYARRKAQHLNPTQSLAGLRIARQLQAGQAPHFVVLERCPDEAASMRAEIFWIELWRLRGAELDNAQCQSGYVERSERRRAALKRLSNGRPLRQGRRWRASETDRLERMVREGVSLAAMADALGRSMGAIRDRMAKVAPERGCG
jgi:hypothetical protein